MMKLEKSEDCPTICSACEKQLTIWVEITDAYCGDEVEMHFCKECLAKAYDLIKKEEVNYDKE